MKKENVGITIKFNDRVNQKDLLKDLTSYIWSAEGNFKSLRELILNYRDNIEKQNLKKFDKHFGIVIYKNIKDGN